MKIQIKKLSIQLIWFFSILSSLTGYGQDQTTTKKIDSLEFLVRNAKHDTIKSELYFQLAEISYLDNPDVAIRYVEKALALARSTKNTRHVIIALMTLANSHPWLEDFTTSMERLNEALKLNKTLKGRPFEARILYRQAEILYEMEMYDSAESMAYLALKVNHRLYNSMVACDIHMLIGSIYAKEIKNRAALEHYILATQIAEESGDKMGAAMGYVNVAEQLANIKEYEKAIRYARMGLELSKVTKNEYSIAYSHEVIAQIYKAAGQYDSALLEMELSIKKYNEIDYFQGVTHLYLLTGEIYEKQNKYDIAIVEYEKVVGNNLVIDKMDLISAFFNLANIYFKLKEDKKSFEYLDSAVKIQKELNSIGSQRDIDELYHQLYARQGNYEKAYKHFDNYVILKDSLESINKKEEILGLEADYQIQKKEDEIRALNAENKTKNIQLYSLVGFGIFSILLIALIYSRYKHSIYVRKKLVELDQSKSRFFANISHEFRTPLTLVMGPIKRRLEQSVNTKDKKEFSSVYRNANRLHTLIDQLLDLSKIESGKMELKVQSGNLGQLMKVVYSYFIHLAESRGIDYVLKCEEDMEGFIDFDKVEKIVFNLLSNAFKYTPEGGNITLRALVEGDHLSVKVIDSGIGISVDKVPYVFDRFYQTDDTSTRKYEGSGIGLALSKELAILHKGKLTVESQEGRGSEFTLLVPIDKKSFKNEISQVSQRNVPVRELVLEEEKVESSVMVDESLPWALVVEDNADMREYMVELLAEEYQILTAVDGQDAWNKILKLVPNVVVCDYMMPNMDGLEFIEKIKRHSLTSHIPIVMVTAKSGEENKLEVLKRGADAFLTKPFDRQELLIVLNNLIEKQKKFEILPHPGKIEDKDAPGYNQADADFIQKLKTIIAENYSKSGFGVEQLTDKLGISKTQFHRKLKAITDKTPVELLRTYRLEQAKKLLLVEGTQVSDVVYKVGYNNLSNFTKIFKEYVGQTPSEFMASEKSRVNI